MGAGPLLLAAAQFRFRGSKVAEAVLPFGLQTASDEPILRLNSSVAAFSPVGFVLRALHFQAPLRQSGVLIGLELLDSEQCRFHRCWCDGFQKSIGHGSLDRQTADVEAVLTAAVDEIFAGAVITRRGVATTIVGMQTAAAMTTGGQTLQQSGTLSHRASSLMGPGARVGVETRLVGLEGCPIDEAGVVLMNENSPLRDGKMTHPLLDGTVFIDVAFAAGLAVGSAGIYRIGQDVMNCRVSRNHPTNLAMTARPAEGKDKLPNETRARRDEPNRIRRSVQRPSGSRR